MTHLGCFCQPCLGSQREEYAYFGLPGRLDFQLWTKGLSIVKCPLVSVEDGLGKEGRGMRRPAVSRRKCLDTNEAFTPKVEQRKLVASLDSGPSPNGQVEKLGYPCVNRLVSHTASLVMR